MSLAVLASNMPFVVSLLWLLYHTVMFTIPLVWAFVYATSRTGSSSPGGAAGGFSVASPDTPNGSPKTAASGENAPVEKAPVEAEKGQKAERGSCGCLGIYSYLAWAICWAAVLLVAIACLGIGDGTIGSWAVRAFSSHVLFSS